MFLCSLLTFAQFSGSGSGTSSDPYLIFNPTQLNQMRNFLNKSGVYFKLMTDIDLTDFLEDESPTLGWQPVGTSSTHFKGVLDGNGYSINGLWINRNSTDYVGLFGYIENTTIKNLTINASDIKGKDYTGIIAGCAKASKISGCSLKGIVNGNGKVGGIIGCATGSVTISSSSLTSKGITGANYTGGICGYSTSIDITSCYVYSNISGINNVGGLLGGSYSELGINNITNCSFVGKICGANYLGGLVGSYRSKAEMKGSYALAHVLGKGNNIGGLVGEASHYPLYALYQSSFPSLTNNYFYGVVNGNEQVGGLVGYVNIGIINYCYTHSSVAGIKNVGGVCGLIESESPNYKSQIFSNIVILSFAKATLSNVGRIYGEKGNNVSIGEIGTKDENKAYNRAIVLKTDIEQDITEDQQNGTSVSATTLKLKATYVAMGWDFNDTWEIQETECYPYMKSQTAPPVITSKVVSGATTISGKCVDGGTVKLEIDGVTQQTVSSNHEFSFTVSPLQAGHEVRVSAKAEGKEQSYYTTEIVAYLGKGTEADPYQIYTASDLTGVYRKGYFKLMNDIDLMDYINQFSPTEGWESIGREGSETIHFDGDGHKITGLWCNSTLNNTGLFSCFANGTIKNLTVETAKGKHVKGGSNTGILIGKMINGTIVNCRVSGTVADGTPVGGLVGLFDGGKISLSQANVTINTTGENSYVGGLVGEITGGEITQCVTWGTLTATGKESYVGGLVGKNYATVSNCYSNAVVTSPYNAAGLIAYNYGIVDKCYATGDIYSNNYGAGVIGYNDGENAVVKNCVAMNNKIDVTYESQQVQQGGGYGQRIIGGIKNGAPAPELNNYALKTMQVSLNNVPQKVYDDIMNGVAKTGTELVKQTTYQELGWDFTNTWTISTETEAYPSLKNNEAVVVKPEDDEPVISNDDIIRVANVDAYKGKNVSVGVTLINKVTDLSAYQFDLTLPSGITLAKDDNNNYLVTKTSRYEDDEQILQVTLLEDNTYRIVCYSNESKKITGTSGALLNIILNVTSTHTAGIFEANIENIVFTKANGSQIKLNSAKFNIEVHKAIMGDANGDGEINVADVVEIVKDILHKTTSKFVREAADVNEDGEINVTDIVLVVNMIMGGNVNSVRGLSQDSYNDVLSLYENGNHSFSLALENRGGYVASQFDLILSKGQTLEGIFLNGNRSNGHMLAYTKTGDNQYKVVVYSLDNQPYNLNEGELLSIKTSGNGNIEIDNILFVTETKAEKRFSPLYSGTLGIDMIESAQPVDIYSVDGRLVRSQAESTNGLTKGIYIINGKKHVVR